MSRVSAENLELFINDVLKADLKHLEEHINNYNADIMEFVQLKNTVETLLDNLPDGFKTQMNIGANMFMEAKVDNLETQKIIVDVGKGYYLEFTLQEALKFADFKIRLLTKESDVLRDESVKKRSDIKMALMCLAQNENLH